MLITNVYVVRIPRIVHDKRDRHLFRLQVAHVDNPDAVDAALVGEVELFAELRHGGGVHPTVVPWATVHVDMIIETQTALALALLLCTLTADVAPVVIAEKECDVIGYGKACIIIALYLGEDSPQLGHGISTSVDVLDNLTLAVDDLVERLHVFRIITFTHGYVAVATHTDSHEVVVVLIALHTLAEELIHAFLIGGVVPRTYLFLALQVLTM